jgi:hypothetical protein
MLLTAGGRFVPVAGIAWTTSHQGTAYNLTVADLHTYHVVVGLQPVLVHNTGSGCIPWITGGLPAAEERALNETLAHIDAATVPTGPTSVKWGHSFKNWSGDLPGGRGRTPLIRSTASLHRRVQVVRDRSESSVTTKPVRPTTPGRTTVTQVVRRSLGFGDENRVSSGRHDDRRCGGWWCDRGG